MNTQRRRTRQSKLANRRAILPYGQSSYDLGWLGDMEIYPTRMSGLGIQDLSGDVFEWYPEGGSMRMDGEVLVIVSGGKGSRYAFDYEKNAYELLPKKTG